MGERVLLEGGRLVAEVELPLRLKLPLPMMRLSLPRLVGSWKLLQSPSLVPLRPKSQIKRW